MEINGNKHINKSSNGKSLLPGLLHETTFQNVLLLLITLTGKYI